ncbi:MAG TPA: four-carbon acid sugar kinase family protein [Clostridia bacterium]|nr:four-carbon acid sugar kinase family protein [Clostridia bacterium]
MVRLLIIADDFTGALDTGVQFSKMGISTQVFLYDDVDWGNIEKHVQVMVVDTQSRHLSSHEAYKRVFQLTKRAKEMGVKFFYKKTDSTLRGNIGSEIAALMDACHMERLPFIPAYPKAGRTTRDGIQYVDDIPLHMTAFAGDPLNPIKEANIAGIINRQTGKVVHSLNMVHIERNDYFHEGKGIFVYDAVSDEDLEGICRLLTQDQGITGIAGCAGFAPYIPRIFNLNTGAKDMGRATRFHKAVLIVCGSINEVSMSQVAYAENRGIKSQLLSPHKMFHNDFLNNPEYETILTNAIDTLLEHGILILKTADEEGDIIFIMGAGDGSPGESTYRIITGFIGSFVRDIMKRTNIGTLVVFGGDTALGIVEGLHCTAILPQTELLTGIPISALGSKLFSGTLITKAGGFGDEGTLMDIINALG